eukprot:gene6218-7743_t
MAFNGDIFDQQQKTYSTTDAGEYRSLMKGIIVFKSEEPNKNSGFHIKHTLGSFPIPTTTDENTFRVPNSHPASWFPNSDFQNDVDGNDRSFGHTFFCHSFPDVIVLSNILKGSHPFIYRTNLFPLPSPYQTTSIKDLFNNQYFSPQSNMINNVTISVSGSALFLSATNLSTTASNKLSQKGYTIVTETHLPYEFSQINSIPPHLQRWRSSIDGSHVSFGLLNITFVCLSDIYNGNTGYDNIETRICVRNEILGRFLKSTAYKVIFSGSIQETILTTPTSFEGPVKMFLNNPFSTETQQSSLLSHYYESIDGSDYFLGNTKIEFTDFQQDIYQGLSDVRIMYTDSNGNFGFRKNYNPTAKLILEDNQLQLKVVKLVQPNNQLIPIEFPLTFATYAIPTISGNDKELIFLYKILQMAISNTNKELISTLNPPPTLQPITVIFNPVNKTATINQINNIVINIESLSIETVLRAYSYYLVTQLNSQYSVVDSLDLYDFDTIQTNHYQPVLRGIVNSISMYLRLKLFPALHQSNLRSLNTWSVPRDIEYFESTGGPSFDVYSSGYTEGWVTSYLWDLIDEVSDSRDNTFYRYDYDSIDIKTLLTVIKNHPVPQSITQFTNYTIINSPTKSSFINQVKLYNNIIDCPQLQKCSPVTMYPYDLKSQFKGRGICETEFQDVNESNLKDIVRLWSGNRDNLVLLDNWSKNRLFAVVYDDPNFFNDKLGKLLPFLRSGDSLDCDFYNLNQDHVSLKLMARISIQLDELINLASQSFTYESVLSLYFIPGINTGGSVSQSFGIVTYNNGLCNFQFMDYTSFMSGSLINSCPISPVITRLSGLSGPPSQNTPITIHGKRILNANLQITVGSKNCPILSSLPGLTPMEDDKLICSGPTGFGEQPISITTSFLSDLPIIYPTREYTFIYDPPQTVTVIYPSSVGIDKLLTTTGSLVTIVGKNFFDRLDNPLLSELIILEVSGTKFSVIERYQANSMDHLVFVAMGVGINNGVTVTVMNQRSTPAPNSQQILLNFKPPTISSISHTSSPVDVGTGKLTVRGQNFPPAPDYINNTAVYIGDALCENIGWIAGIIIADIPVNVGKDLSVYIEVSGQISQSINEGESEFKFSYDAPQLYQVVWQKIQTNESSPFWITGLNFGTKGGYTPMVSLLLPPAIEGQEPEKVNLECFPDNTVFMNKPDNPENTEYDPYKDLDSQYKTSKNFDCIICFNSQGIGAGFNFTVQVFNQFVESSQLQYGEKKSISFNKPHIFGIIPSEPVTTDGNITLCFNGTDFVPNELVEALNSRLDPEDEKYTTFDTGLAFNNISFEFNDEIKFECNKDLHWNSSYQVNCTIPEGYGSNLTVKLFVGGQPLDQKFLFSYQRPNITKPQEKLLFPLGKEHNMTIVGTNFIPKSLVDKVNQNQTHFKDIHQVYIRDNECKNITYIDSKSIKCTVPIDSGADIPVKVMIGNVTSEVVAYYSYEKPKITELRPRNGRRSEKTMLTIVGENFGNLNKKPDPKVKMDDQELNSCQPFTKIEDGDKENKNQIICEVGPFNQEKDYTLVVELNNQTSDHVYFKSYGKPVITDISRSSGSIIGGYDIAIDGNNFVEDRGGPVLYVKGVPVAIKTFTNTQIVFTCPEGGGVGIEFRVDVNGQIASTRLFSYLPPLITSIIPPSIPSYTARLINIRGSNLGLSSSTNHLTITVGGFPCGNVVVISHEYVKCLAPYSKPGTVSVINTFENQPGSGTLIITQTPTPTPLSTTGWPGFPSLLPILTMLALLPAVSFTLTATPEFYAAIVTVELKFTTEAGVQIFARLIARTVGEVILLNALEKDMQEQPELLEFVDGVLGRPTNSSASSSMLHQQKQVDHIQKMSFSESRSHFAKFSDAQIQSSPDHLVSPELILAEGSYILDHGHYYEVSTTISILTSAMVGGVRRDNIALNGVFYGSVDKPS